MEINEPAPKFYNQYMTPGEYLEFERKATEKHEYVDGEVLPMNRTYKGPYAMAGAQLKHVKIVNDFMEEFFSNWMGKDVMCHSKTFMKGLNQ